MPWGPLTFLHTIRFLVFFLFAQGYTLARVLKLHKLIHCLDTVSQCWLKADTQTQSYTPLGISYQHQIIAYVSVSYTSSMEGSYLDLLVGTSLIWAHSSGFFFAPPQVLA